MVGMPMGKEHMFYGENLILEGGAHALPAVKEDAIRAVVDPCGVKGFRENEGFHVRRLMVKEAEG
jgi:hypothetical protein